MNPSNADIQSRFVNALRTQANPNVENCVAGPLPCPYCHYDRIFQNIDQLLDHARSEHSPELDGLAEGQARNKLQEAAFQFGQNQRQKPDSDRLSSPDIAALSQDLKSGRRTSPSGRKRPAESECCKRAYRIPSDVEIVYPDYSGHLRSTPLYIERQSQRRDYNFRPGAKGTVSPRRYVEQPGIFPSDNPVNNLPAQKEPLSPNRRATVNSPTPGPQHQPGLIKLQKYDHRFPGLLLQPESRPISQEQLASEVKSIYAGLTMVETKCIHVDRAQAAATAHDPTQKLAPDHWQALIALHRTLLHEHHDFFLASQHPSAAPALRRLAAEYAMPARMWKHGLNSFLELLRSKMPKSRNYEIAFIFLSYQMTLLSKLVPPFLDTHDEYLDGLLRHIMSYKDAGTDIHIQRFSPYPDKGDGRMGISSSITSLFGQPQTKHPEEEDIQQRYDHGQSKWWLELRWGQWLGALFADSLVRLQSLLLRILAHERTPSGFCRALASLLLVSKTATAAETRPPQPSPGLGLPPTSLGPLLRDKTPLDYAMYVLLALYLLGACVAPHLVGRVFGQLAGDQVRNAAKWSSFALMAAMAFIWVAIMGDILAAGIYISVLKIWAVTACHFIVVDCVDAIEPRFHVVKFLGFAVLTEFFGLSMQQFAAQGALKTLPPSLTAAALLNWGLYQLGNHAPSSDVERGSEGTVDSNAHGEEQLAIELAAQTHRRQTGPIEGASQPRRRNSFHLQAAELRSEGPQANGATSSDTGASSVIAGSHHQQTGTVNEVIRSNRRNRSDLQSHAASSDNFSIGDDSDDLGSLLDQNTPLQSMP